MAMEDDGLEQRLRRVLARHSGLRVAVLFGSHARGTARAGSDVDVAVLPASGDLSLSQEHQLATELERAAGAAVDLVRIDRASPRLRWRIARDGIVLLSNPAHAASRFLARSGIEHDEMRVLRLDAMRRYRARIASGAEQRR